jgi:ERCC4-type nuclease
MHRKTYAQGRKKAEKTLKETIYANIIIDSREKKPWEFSEGLPSGFFVKETKTIGLPCGDYSLEGFDNKDGIIIERKNSIEEIIGNFGKNWERFQKELDKLAEYKRSYILVEDDLRDSFARYGARNPKKGMYFTLSPDFIIKRACEIDYKWGVKTLFLSNKYFAKKYMCNIFKALLEGNLDKKLD